MVRVEVASREWMEALVEGDDAFAERFGIPVEPGWAEFPEVLPWALEHAPDPWGTHLFFDDDVDGALVGNGGWKGPPVDGVAELGYAVAPGRRNRGIASAVVRTLLDRARRDDRVTLVVAHTLAEPSASTRVLERCGFVNVGTVDDPDDGPVWRWERGLA